jgi:CHAT domain
MNLQQVVMTNFVLLQATCSGENSRQLIGRLQPSHVIVSRRGLQEDYYLFSVQEATNLLAQALRSSSVEHALRLDEQMPTPTLGGETDAELAPDRCVILEDDRLIGFFDGSMPPHLSTARRGDGTEHPITTPDLPLRSLVAEMPDTVQVQKRFSLLVFLSASPTPQAGVSLPVALPLGTPVDILVQPRHGIILDEGDGEGTLIVTEEEETLPLQFKLRGISVGAGSVRVFAFHQGQPLGALAVHVVIQEELANQQRSSHYQEQPLGPVHLQQPDLSLVILEHVEAGIPTLTFRLTASDPALELNLKPFGPIRLKVDPLRYFQDFFLDIETLPLRKSNEKAIAVHRLAAKGASLFTTLFPADLQVLLWSLRDRIRSVLVQSEEPWIPWELCKLCGQENGRVVEGPFLCEAFAITRWLPGIPIKQRLSLNNIAVVVPADSGLACVAEERSYLMSLSEKKRSISAVPATFLELREALASGSYDAWHFSGHGGFREMNPNQSVLCLEHSETLTPEDLNGVVSNLGRSQPLVFFNACQLGQNAMSLTSMGGWANQLLHIGAGAFIGAYWSIYDSPACAFAQAFYRLLLSGMPICKAAQQARIEIKSDGDPTWLAYTVFADPLATVERESS